MKYSVELSERAEHDIKDAFLYIQKNGPASPVAWREGLREKLISLESYPEAHGFAPENALSRVEVRQLLYGPFRILFQVSNEVVHVLTVRHGARRFLRADELK